MENPNEFGVLRIPKKKCISKKRGKYSKRIWGPVAKKCCHVGSNRISARRSALTKEEQKKYDKGEHCSQTFFGDEKTLQDVIDKDIDMDVDKITTFQGSSFFYNQMKYYLKKMFKITEDNKLTYGGLCPKPYNGPKNPWDIKRKLFPHQKIVKEIMKPVLENYGNNPATSRILLAHRVGSGKTTTFIEILRLYLKDRRPKIFLTSEAVLQRNFLEDGVMSYKNEFSDYVFDQYKKLPDEGDLRKKYWSKSNVFKPGSNGKKFRFLFIQDCLEIKVKTSRKKSNILDAGKKGFLLAPIRSATFSNYDNQLSTIKYFPKKKTFQANDKRGLDRGAMKFYNDDTKNIFSNKIIIVDEAHNLYAPCKDIASKAKKIKQLLASANNSVVVFATATPFGNDGSTYKQERIDLCNLLKGTNYTKSEECDGFRGFVSYFNDGEALFPRFKGMSSTALPRLPKVKYVGVSTELYNKYYLKNFNRINKNVNLETETRQQKKRRIIRLQNVTNAPHPVFQYRANMMNKYTKEYVTKFFHIAKNVLESKEKTLIVISKNHSFKGLAHVLRNEFKDAVYFKSYNKKIEVEPSKDCDFTKEGSNGCIAAFLDKKSMNVKSKDVKDIFNSKENDEGKRIKALVVNSDVFKEGISFLNVKKIIFTNPPISYSNYLQLCGRITRSCKFSEKERVKNAKIDIVMYCSSFNKEKLRNENNVVAKQDDTTPDEDALKMLQTDMKEYKEKMKELENDSFDKDFYEKDLEKDEVEKEIEPKRACQKELNENMKMIQEDTESQKILNEFFSNLKKENISYDDDANHNIVVNTNKLLQKVNEKNKRLARQFLRLTLLFTKNQQKTKITVLILRKLNKILLEIYDDDKIKKYDNRIINVLLFHLFKQQKKIMEEKSSLNSLKKRILGALMQIEKSSREQSKSLRRPSSRRPSKRRPSKRRPSKRRPSKRRPSKRRPSKRRPSKRRPSKRRPSKRRPSKRHRSSRSKRNYNTCSKKKDNKILLMKFP